MSNSLVPIVCFCNRKIVRTQQDVDYVGIELWSNL